MNIVHLTFADFPEGLDNYQLKMEISAVIANPCNDVATISEDVYIYFENEVSPEDLTALEPIINAHVPIPPTTSVRADRFEVLNVLNDFGRFSLSETTIPASEEYSIAGEWTRVAGNMEGFAAGVFTAPTTGIYFYNFILNTTGANTNDEIHIRVRDAQTDTFIYGLCGKLSTTVQPTHSFIGNGEFMLAGTQRKFTVYVVDSFNISCEFKVMKTMDASI